MNRQHLNLATGQTDTTGMRFGRIRARRGNVLIFTAAALVVMIGFVSFAVDLGRAQLAKTQLASAADAAARSAAWGLADGTSVSRAIAAAADNTVDGTTLVLQSADVTIGTWNSSTRTFTAGGSSPRAVKVVAYRNTARGTAIPLVFASVLGKKTIDLSATSIATYTAGSTTTLTAPSSGNPWLAGMPAGTTGNWYDSAPNNSPAQITGISITPGAKLNFGFTGSASYYPGTQPFDPDGNTGWIINNYAGREHGKSQLNAPLGAVVGIFLDDRQPDQAGSPPPDLDFSTAASRDFATLSPQLRQPFFIGNGVRADGTTKQDFIVPAGATRFYLGIMDGQQWSDNAGSLSSTVVNRGRVTLVK